MCADLIQAKMKILKLQVQASIFKLYTTKNILFVTPKATESLQLVASHSSNSNAVLASTTIAQIPSN